MPYKIYPGVDEDYKFPPLVRKAMVLYSEMIAAFSGKYLEKDVSDHIANRSNPHVVTKSQVGLGNADNTSDVNKPISSSTQNALNLKAPLASPTFTGTVSGITKAMVGLGNVDNTSDANAPVSAAMQNALNAKAPIASPTFTGTVGGVTKAHVGLSNVDNTSDMDKPVSTAQLAAFVPRWKPSTAYMTGTQVISPTNSVVTATTTHVSTGTFDPTKWTVPTDVGNLAKGRIAEVTNTGSVSVGAGTSIAPDIRVVNLVAGRKYRAHYMFNHDWAGVNHAGAISLKKSIVSDTTPSGTDLDEPWVFWSAPVVSSGFRAFAIFEWTATATETVNIKGVLVRVVGTQNLNAATRKLVIYDDGAQF